MYQLADILADFGIFLLGLLIYFFPNRDFTDGYPLAAVARRH